MFGKNVINQFIELNWRIDMHRIPILRILFFLSIACDALNFFMQKLFGGTDFVIVGLKGAILVVLMMSIRRGLSYLYICTFTFLAFVRIALNLIRCCDVYDTDFVILFRFLLMLTFVMAFREASNDELRKIIRGAFWVLLIQSAVVVVAFVFGVHFFDAYEFRAGYKGLFVHINDEAFMMAGGLLLALQRAHELRDRSWAFCGLALLLAMMIMGLGSRTALLGAAIAPMLYLCAVYLRRPTLVPAKLFLGIIIIGIGFGLAVVAFWQTIQESIISQLLQVYAQSGSVVNAVTTGRDVYIGYLLKDMVSVPQVALGAFVSKSNLSSQMIESDIFDIWFRFGAVGLVLFSGLIVAFYGNSLRRGNSSLWAFLILLILIGGMTGHVLISSQNSTWVAFFLCYFHRFGTAVVISRARATPTLEEQSNCCKT